MTGRPRRAALASAALTAAAILAVAGCAAGPNAAAGKSGTTNKTSTAAANGAAGKAGTAADGASTATAACNPTASSLPPASSPGQYVATIRQRGYLIAGVDQSTYHFGFFNPLNDNIEGFDIDMINDVAEAIFGPDYAQHVQLKAISDANRVKDVRDGTVDIVAHTMSIDCARLNQIDFSTVYYNARAELMVLNDSNATSIAGLKGQRVCATSGSDDVAIIQKNGGIPVQATYWSDCLMDLQQGEVAGIVSDDAILHGLAAQDPWAKIIDQPLEAEPYGLGISKLHPDFVRFVNGVLTKIFKDGQWKASYTHWVGGAAPAPPTPRYR